MKRLGASAIGALGGFVYYYFVGCTSGSCPISSNPWISTAYGALIGIVMTTGSTKKRVQEERVAERQEK
jgi:hypothetical protein